MENPPHPHVFQPTFSYPSVAEPVTFYLIPFRSKVLRIPPQVLRIHPKVLQFSPNMFSNLLLEIHPRKINGNPLSIRPLPPNPRNYKTSNRD